MFNFIKKAAQSVRDLGASVAYGEAFSRLANCTDYILDFDVSLLPSDPKNVDIEKARALGAATELKQIARRAELLQSAHELDMSDYDEIVVMSLPMSVRLALIPNLMAEDHLDRNGEVLPYWSSTRDNIISHRDHHFARSIGSLSKVERAVWKAAMYWESQGLRDRFNVDDIHLFICWAGAARLYATRPPFVMEESVWPAYLKQLDEIIGQAVGTSYDQFLQRQVAYFENTADHGRLGRIAHFDPDGVIKRFSVG